MKTIKAQVKIIDFNTILNASIYSAVENLFNPGMQTNVCLHFLNVERENFSKGNLIDGITKAIVQGGWSGCFEVSEVICKRGRGYFTVSEIF